MNNKYIYCIIQSNHKKDFGEEMTTVNYRDLSAVVSDCSMKEFTVSRENTMKHEKAIENIMKEQPVLPVRFSTVADSENEIIEKVLVPRYDEFVDMLLWIGDKEEIGVRARWMDMELVFKDIVEEDGRIKELKEKIAKKRPEQTYYERIDLGKLIEERLKEKKAMEKDRIIETLKKEAEDYKVNEVYGDDAIINSAFLVKKEKEANFFGSVSKLQDGYGPEVQLRYVTGSPPFNFVNLVIKL